MISNDFLGRSEAGRTLPLVDYQGHNTFPAKNVHIQPQPVGVANRDHKIWIFFHKIYFQAIRNNFLSQNIPTVWYIQYCLVYTCIINMEWLTSKLLTALQFLLSSAFLFRYSSGKKPLEGCIRVVQCSHAGFMQTENVLWAAATVLECLAEEFKQSWNFSCWNRVPVSEWQDMINLREQLLRHSWIEGRER